MRYSPRVRAGRWWALGLATAAGIAALALTDRERVTTETVTLPIEESMVRADLDRVARQAGLLGYRVVRRHDLDGLADVVESVPAVEGRCGLVAIGAWGHHRVRRLRSTTPGSAPRLAWGPAAWDRARPSHVLTLCARPETELLTAWADLVAIDGRTGGGEVLVMEGQGPAPAIPSTTPVLVVEERTRREPAWSAALINGAASFIVVLLIGLLVEIGVTRRANDAPREVSLRRISVALPSASRATIAPLADDARRGGLLALRDLRDALATSVDEVERATFAHWRAADAVIGERLRTERAAIDRRRSEARGASYRAIDEGGFVVTLLVRHSCELPDLPLARAATRSCVKLALEALLPAEEGELIDALVTIDPADPSAALDAAQLDARYRELVPLDGRASQSCAACHALVSGAPADCPTCRARFKPRA